MGSPVNTPDGHKDLPGEMVDGIDDGIDDNTGEAEDMNQSSLFTHQRREDKKDL